MCIRNFSNEATWGLAMYVICSYHNAWKSTAVDISLKISRDFKMLHFRIKKIKTISVYIWNVDNAISNNTMFNLHSWVYMNIYSTPIIFTSLRLSINAAAVLRLESFWQYTYIEYAFPNRAHFTKDYR